MTLYFDPASLPVWEARVARCAGPGYWHSVELNAFLLAAATVTPAELNLICSVFADRPGPDESGDVDACAAEAVEFLVDVVTRRAIRILQGEGVMERPAEGAAA